MISHRCGLPGTRSSGLALFHWVTAQKPVLKTNYNPALRAAQSGPDHMHVMPCLVEGNKAERPPMQVWGMVLRHRVVGALNHRPRHSYLTEHV